MSADQNPALSERRFCDKYVDCDPEPFAGDYCKLPVGHDGECCALERDWRESFREWEATEATPLGLTIPGPHQGVAGLAQFTAGRYPACSKHGAMNKVAAEAPLWRCLQCNIGIELNG